MVLEIATDPLIVGDDADSQAPQGLCRPDAGQHQQLRRTYDAGAQDHFTGGTYYYRTAGGVGFYPNRLPALEQDASHPRPRPHGRSAESGPGT